MDRRETNKREDIFSKPVRAGKRTYFFDVKATRGNDYYLTITESKRRIDDNGKFSYDKHKLFLYKEDFEKFAEGLESVFEFIREAKGSDYGIEQKEYETQSATKVRSNGEEAASNDDDYSSNISFDDLEEEDK